VRLGLQEWLAVELAGRFALGAEAEAVVLHSVVLDLGTVRVGSDLECHEVGDVTTRGLLELREDIAG
jgi:hypothetical protein